MCSARTFHVLKSLGNLNNHFGLPMQLLRLEAQHDFAVIEMGMSYNKLVVSSGGSPLMKRQSSSIKVRVRGLWRAV